MRTETGLGSGAVSVSYAAVALANKIFGNLDGRAVMVIGAGEMGKLTAQHMKSQGVRHVTIVSRTMAHAARTADAIGGATATPWDDMDAALTASDIVITATGAAAPILTKARIEAAMRPRRNRPLFIIDIAVPRDVEPAAAELEDVFLYNIDDLQAAVRENMARRTSEVTRAEAIVDEELDKFGSWLRARGVIPTVVALRQSFESIRRAELDRLDFKLSALPRPDEARARVDEITHLIIEKLLLTPTEQLKALGDQETAAQYTRRARPRVRACGFAAERDVRTANRAAGTQSARPVACSRSGARGRAISADVAPLPASSGSAPEAARSPCGRPTPSRRPSRGEAARPAASSSSGHRAIAIADGPLSEAGGKRLFVKEIEDALLRNDVDLAVHSSKDMPALLPEGLAIAAVLPREDPLDAVVLPVTDSAQPSAVQPCRI